MKYGLIVALWFSTSFSVLAGENVDQTLAVDKQAFVKIEHVNGQAEISSWDKAEVKVTGTLGDQTDKFIFERDGDDVLIKVKVKKHNGWGNWGSDKGDDLKIFVPQHSRIKYSSVNADVEIRNIAGGAEVETVNGAIEAKKLGNRVKIESVNGNIDATELEGDVSIETVNGNINSRSSKGREDHFGSVNGNIFVTTDSQELQAETVNGNVELSLGAVRKLSLESVNGGLEARMNLLANGEVNASSVGGVVELYFQHDVSARFDIQAHAGGNIVNKLSDDKMQKNKYGPSRWLEFALNGGSARVNVSTVSGRVKLDSK